jgi:hypothetical protein
LSSPSAQPPDTPPPTSTDTPEDRRLHAALDELGAALDAIGDAIDAMGGRQEGFDWATRTGATITSVRADLSQRAETLKARAAAKIWEANNLSLAGLANRIGMSKARADQLVRAGVPGWTPRPRPEPKTNPEAGRRARRSAATHRRKDPHGRADDSAS